MSLYEHDITATLAELNGDYNLTEEEYHGFIQAQMGAASSALRSAGVARSTVVPSDVRGKVTRIPISFSGKLSGQKQVLMRQLYPDFEISFKQEQEQSHAAAACARTLDRALLKKRAPAGQHLLSVGGNYEYELLHSRSPVHSCTPDHSLVGDYKEAARDVQRMARIRAMAKGIKCSDEVAERAAGFLADPTPWRCRKLVQDCDHPAGVIMMAHVYDMSLEQVVQAMVSHDSKLVLGCILFSNQMLTSPVGRLPNVDGYYTIADGKISFGFERESQWEYTHDWEQLRRYGFSGAVVQSGDRQGFYTITEVRGDTLFFSMTLAPKTVPVLPLKKSWRVDGDKRVVVKSFKLSEVDRTSERRALVPAEFSYPYDPFVKSLSYAIERIEKGSFSLEDLQRKVRAVFADMTINSVRVAGFNRLEDDQLAYYLSNVGILAALSVHRSGVDEVTLIDGVKIQRNALSQGIFSKIGTAFSKLFRQPFGNASPVFQKWRSIMNAFTLDDDIISQVSWAVDMGYRYAECARPTGDVDTTAVSVADDAFRRGPNTHEIKAALEAAAMSSPEFALVLAETAAAISPSPDIEQWATELREKHSVAVNNVARAAEREMLTRLEDPDVLFQPVEGSSQSAIFGKGKQRDVSVTAVDAVTEDEEVDKVAPVLVAANLGISLDSSDEVSLHPQQLADVDKVANAAIEEAIFLIEEDERKILGECRKNFEQVTVKGVPTETSLKKHGKLNYDPDFWFLEGDARLPETSLLGVKINPTDRFFPYAAVYIPDSDVIVRVTNTLVDKQAGVYSHHVYLPSGVKATGLVMTTTQLERYNGPVIVSNMRNALKISLPKDFSLSFVEGVPGCGKTHYIIHNVPADGVVIACGRENADTTRERIKEFSIEHPGTVPFKQPIRGVRTLDSALMMPTADRKGTMFLDECFQDHAGKFWAVIKLWRATQVQALGDRMQIPFYDRNNTGKCHLPRLSHWSLRVGKYLTRRCPRDATAAIACYYDRKIRTTSLLNNSLELQLNTPNIPNLPGWKYLVMYQDDKHALLRRGFVEVNTVTEVQGQTYERVALVRLQERDMPLFNDDAQVDVALSRHTKQFIYYAPDERNDLLQRLVKTAGSNLSLIDKYGDVSTTGIDVLNI